MLADSLQLSNGTGLVVPESAAIEFVSLSLAPLRPVISGCRQDHARSFLPIAVDRSVLESIGPRCVPDCQSALRILRLPRQRSALWQSLANFSSCLCNASQTC